MVTNQSAVHSQQSAVNNRLKNVKYNEISHFRHYKLKTLNSHKLSNTNIKIELWKL